MPAALGLTPRRMLRKRDASDASVGMSVDREWAASATLAYNLVHTWDWAPRSLARGKVRTGEPCAGGNTTAACMDR